MAPADNTPDFDAMTPDEIMTWMETLAKRQGVKSEELTTSADVDIPIIDPDSVVIDEPGYVPYGEERPPKPVKPAPAITEPPMAAPSPRPTEAPFPPPTQAPRPFSAPPPRPQASQPEEQGPARPLSPLTPRPQAPPPSGLNPLRPPSTPPTRPMPTAPATPPRPTPDFAARPAAQTPPSTSSQPPAPRQTSEFTAQPPSQPAAQNPPSVAQPPARPAPATPPQNPRTAFEPPKWLTTRPLSSPTPPAPPPAPTQQPAWSQPKPPAESKQEPAKSISGDTDAMAWLESLAADQGDSLFNLDLSSLMESPAVEEEPASSLDPVAWLQNLSHSQDMDDSTDLFARPEAPAQPVAAAPQAPTVSSAPGSSADDVPTVSDPFDSGVDPIAWLENLARRQGAKSEELTTSVSMDIPVPENPVIDEPGYNPFSFDSPVERRRPQRSDQTPFTLENSNSWPETDDEAQTAAPTAQDDADVSAIERAISEGTVSPEQMQAYLEHQTDIYVDDLANGDDEPVDEDAPPVPAELPDWLLEQVGAPPVEAPTTSAADASADMSAFDDMPEWLREDSNQSDDATFAGIFDDLPDEEDSQGLTTEPAFAGYTIEIDRSDPWVEAFEAEQEDGLPDITELPDWYMQNLSDPDRVAAVEQMASAPALAEAALPQETELKAGQPVDLPDWIGPSRAEEPALVAEMPDWLLEIDAASIEPEEIPDWLNDSVDDDDDDDGIEEMFPPEQPAAVITPEPIRFTPPVQPKPEPVAAAPVQRPAASADLNTARTHAQSGDVESSVASYEALIRVNRELDQVVDDLTRLSKVHRSNPAVHRVLGDGLMRQGKLQAALDVYREALNQL